MFDMDTGFYVFPPNPQHIVKVAIHAAGYVNTSNPPNPQSRNEHASQSAGVSVPRTIMTPGAEDGMIPKKMVKDLRDGLRSVFPKLAEKDFFATRLCWYADTPDGDWLIDWHPGKEGLLLATAGCGHAFKVRCNEGQCYPFVDGVLPGRHSFCLTSANRSWLGSRERWLLNSPTNGVSTTEPPTIETLPKIRMSVGPAPGLPSSYPSSPPRPT
jgi:hypothetical protein